jgi:hypothetical protein
VKIKLFGEGDHGEVIAQFDIRFAGDEPLKVIKWESGIFVHFASTMTGECYTDESYYVIGEGDTRLD